MQKPDGMPSGFFNWGNRPLGGKFHEIIYRRADPASGMAFLGGEPRPGTSAAPLRLALLPLGEACVRKCYLCLALRFSATVSIPDFRRRGATSAPVAGAPFPGAPSPPLSGELSRPRAPRPGTSAAPLAARFAVSLPVTLSAAFPA